ncbi:hypothetical protein BKA59DRAFT_474200 [Fusarium tricinctum]|jgi:hypothetical protein|uniref:Uncharacterized protein n=1 Tax=Fusarium tricinctum TaxID=61284 RepID=A0A8K0S5K6_9HYPO|nr:hypothetical protein BKA59DRAFT_474200 [Fusarium tricinctum]
MLGPQARFTLSLLLFMGLCLVSSSLLVPRFFTPPPQGLQSLVFTHTLVSTISLYPGLIPEALLQFT